MADFQTPAVDWRKLNGVVDDENQKKMPPGLIDYSTSEGDMRKRVYRRSKYPGAFTMSVVNDDGTPMAEESNALLTEIKGLLERIAAKLEA